MRLENKSYQANKKKKEKKKKKNTGKINIRKKSSRKPKGQPKGQPKRKNKRKNIKLSRRVKLTRRTRGKGGPDTHPSRPLWKKEGKRAKIKKKIKKKSAQQNTLERGVAAGVGMSRGTRVKQMPKQIVPLADEFAARAGTLDAALEAEILSKVLGGEHAWKALQEDDFKGIKNRMNELFYLLPPSWASLMDYEEWRQGIRVGNVVSTTPPTKFGWERRGDMPPVVFAETLEVAEIIEGDQDIAALHDETQRLKGMRLTWDEDQGEWLEEYENPSPELAAGEILDPWGNKDHKESYDRLQQLQLELKMILRRHAKAVGLREGGTLPWASRLTGPIFVLPDVVYVAPYFFTRNIVPIPHSDGDIKMDDSGAAGFVDISNEKDWEKFLNESDRGRGIVTGRFEDHTMLLSMKATGKQVVDHMIKLIDIWMRIIHREGHLHEKHRAVPKTKEKMVV